MSVFYSYSNNCDSIANTYELIYNDLSDCIIDVDINNKTNELDLFKKIKAHIDSADIFVCDITPDHIFNDKIPLVNPNVMLELSYALEKYVNSDIILLFDTSKKYPFIVPSLLDGYYVTTYNSTHQDYKDDIIQTIKDYLDKKIQRTNKNGWVTFNYNLPDVFLANSLINLTDYIIRYNREIKKCVILFKLNNTYIKKIDVMKKQIFINNKAECLSKYNILFDEIKHLEIIIRQIFI